MAEQPPRLWTMEDLAEHLGVPLATLYRWRSMGTSPRGIRCGRYVRFRQEDVERWLEERSDPRSAA